MKKVLDRLAQAVTHLKTIENFFIKKVPAYARNEERLEKLGRFYDEFARELYAGGRKDGHLGKGNRFHRGMTLADLLTYTVFGRGFYVLKASDVHRKAFIEIVMRISNKLLLQENISVDPKLRKGLLNALLSHRIPNFFEDDEQKTKIKQLKAYNGPIIWDKKGTEFYKIMDSILPKSRGLAIEFLIYLYLIHCRFGFVIPLLLHQRLITKGGLIAPPDFLVLKNDGRIFGIEVGSLKEGQNTNFITTTSIPTITAELDNDQPFRCPKCQQWITYCDQVIKTYSEGISKPNPFKCKNCKYFNKGRCQDIIFFGKIPKLTKGNRRYHYRCVAKEKTVKILIKKNRLNEHFKVWYPTASIIDALNEERNQKEKNC
ncbi:MAG: hypothetical protein JW749_10880 [Sedimentisphaerales bacterium]|nr:hypothetical protein [Sedimentisphaerales bacterium]